MLILVETNKYTTQRFLNAKPDLPSDREKVTHQLRTTKMFLDKKTPLVAVDISAHSVVIAQLKQVKDRLELMSLGARSLGEGCVIDGAIERPGEVVDALRQLLKTEEIKTRHAVTSLHGDAAIIKKIETPVMSEEELAENIGKEAEQHIPFDVSDVRFDFQIIGPVQNERNGEDSLAGWEGFAEEEMMEVLIIAALNEVVDSRFDILTEAGLRPVILDIDILAAANALNFTTDLSTMGPVALVDLGDPLTQVSVLNNGVTSFARETPVHGTCHSSWITTQFRLPFERTTKTKQRKTPENLGEGSAIWEGTEWEKLLVDDSEKKLSLKTVVAEMERVFTLFTEDTNEPIKRIFICGIGTLVSEVDALLAGYFKVPVEIINPFKSIKVNPKRFNHETLNNFGSLATVPIGLATRRFDYE